MYIYIYIFVQRERERETERERESEREILTFKHDSLIGKYTRTMEQKTRAATC